MKKIIPIMLTLLMVFFVSTSVADRGYGRDDGRNYISQGERIERHLDTQGDRIQQRFVHKAERAMDQGKYSKARHFQKKGKQINRQLDHKGNQIHARFDRHRHNKHIKQRHHNKSTYLMYPAQDYRHDNYLSLMIRQPGFLFGWGWHQ